MRRAFVVALVLLACKDKSKPADRRPPPNPTAAAPSRGLALPGRSPAVRPPRPPALISTAFNSSFAEASNTSAAWTALAEAYERELADCKVECREVAYDVVLARNRAMKAANLKPPPGEEPLALPPEVQANVDALDAYIERLEPTDDEYAPMKFLAASSLWRWRQASALPRLEQILREHRDDATAEYAANQLLDWLVRAQRWDELRAWVAELSADETFLANKPELRATLEHLRELLATQR